jgi:hypothetical protein
MTINEAQEKYDNQLPKDEECDSDCECTECHLRHLRMDEEE